MTDSLHVDERGQGGVPVVFVHSFAGDVSHWASALAHLQQTRRVLALDLSGHGTSHPVAGEATVKKLAQDISSAVDSRQLTQFVLVGHSLGAAVAAEYAGTHGQRVHALVLVDPPLAPGALTAEQIGQLERAAEADPYSVVEQFWNEQLFIDASATSKQKLLTSLRRMARTTATELTKASFNYDATRALRQYAGPKFAIVTARNDIPLSLHRAVPGIHHVVIAGTGHWIQLDKPQEFLHALDGILGLH